MKNIVRVLIFISISLIVLNCDNDEKLPVQGKVQFALTVASKSSDGGRITSGYFPDGVYISLSIETAAGVPVDVFKRIELIKLGENYISGAVDLIEGNYRLTDFMIMSKDNEVLYATPKEGSNLANLVANPLPIHFTITKDGIVNLNVQVVDVMDQSALDFGYISFTIEVVGGDFSISMFKIENKNLVFASGTLQLYRGNELVHTQSLSPQINTVNYIHSPEDTYTIVVRKEGYTIKSREYKVNALQDELQGKPLVFIIEPAVTFEIIPKFNPDTTISHPFFLGMLASSSDFQIDWGDGTIEKPVGYSNSDGMMSFSFSHAFDGLAGKRLFINITGNIARIDDFRYSYSLPVLIQNLDITSLTGLTTFVSVITFDDAPDFIDFSRNIKLTTISLDDSHIQKIDISNNPALQYLSISGTSITGENLTETIRDLHKNVIANNIQQGQFGFRMWPEQPLLTQESKSKLIDLRDNYHWLIVPELQ